MSQPKPSARQMRAAIALAMVGGTDFDMSRLDSLEKERLRLMLKRAKRQARREATTETTKE